MAKSSTRKPQGLMQIMPIPTRPWEVVTMDLLTGLPPSSGFDSVVVFVDKLSKMIRAVTITKEISGEGLGRVVIDNVFCLFGAPSVVISDRDPRMMGAHFLTAMMSDTHPPPLTTHKRTASPSGPSACLKILYAPSSTHVRTIGLSIRNGSSLHTTAP